MTSKTRHDGELVDEIASKIRGDIWQGRCAVGTRLRQEALALEFGVSRTPVREALRKLQAEGIIVFVPRRGALVRRPSPRELREAYRVRAELEGLGAELAARWIDDFELQGLERADEAFRELTRCAPQGKAGAPPDESMVAVTSAWTEANDAFHEAIHHAARNAALIDALTFLHRSIPRGLTGSAVVANSRLLQQNAAEHHEIRVAIEGRQADVARSLMVEHVLHSGEIAVSWFELQERALQPKL